MAGSRKKQTGFSLSKGPDRKNFRLFFLFLVLGSALIGVNVLIPNFFEGFYKQFALRSLDRFYIGDNVPGAFRNSDHVYDNTADALSSRLALQAYASANKTPPQVNAIKKYISELEPTNLSELEILTSAKYYLNDVSGEQANKVYESVLEYYDSDSGAFALSTDSDAGQNSKASMLGTYYAFQAIDRAGKMEEFRKTSEFSSSIDYMISLKDTNLGGYRQAAGESPNLLVTNFALQTILFSNNKEILDKAFAKVDEFVLSCRGVDGGFGSVPADTEGTTSRSTVRGTISGVYVLLRNRERGGAAHYAVEQDALNFVRSCISHNGIRNQFHHTAGVDLYATAEYFDLLATFPSEVSFGVPPDVSKAPFALGISLVALSLFYYFRAQFPAKVAEQTSSVARASVLFLVCSMLALQYGNRLFVVFYASYVFFLLIQALDACLGDPTQDLAGLAITMSIIHFGLAYAFQTVSTLDASSVTTYIFTLGFSGASVVLGTIVAPYMINPHPLELYVQASFVSWVLNLVLSLSFFVASDTVLVVLSRLHITGSIYLVTVGFPIISFVMSVILGALGFTVNVGGTTKDKAK